jgi:hypothetical protein
MDWADWNGFMPYIGVAGYCNIPVNLFLRFLISGGYFSILTIYSLKSIFSNWFVLGGTSSLSVFFCAYFLISKWF